MYVMEMSHLELIETHGCNMFTCYPCQSHHCLHVPLEVPCVSSNPDSNLGIGWSFWLLLPLWCLQPVHLWNPIFCQPLAFFLPFSLRTLACCTWISFHFSLTSASLPSQPPEQPHSSSSVPPLHYFYPSFLATWHETHQMTRPVPVCQIAKPDHSSSSTLCCAVPTGFYGGGYLGQQAVHECPPA